MKGSNDIVLTATDERRLAQLLQAKAHELEQSTLELLEGEGTLGGFTDRHGKAMVRPRV